MNEKTKIYKKPSNMEAVIKDLLAKHTDIKPENLKRLRSDVNICFELHDAKKGKLIAKILGNKDCIDPYKQFELIITPFLQKTEFGKFFLQISNSTRKEDFVSQQRTLGDPIRRKRAPDEAALFFARVSDLVHPGKHEVQQVESRGNRWV